MARAITSAEFTEIMDKLMGILNSRESKRKLRVGESWKVSYDNDKVHIGADLTEVGIEEEDRFPLPACSSDMHKVVEHVHGWLTAKMQKWLEKQDDAALTAQQCKEKLERLFLKYCTKESISADVATLKATYQAIIDAQGGYPPKEFR